MRRGRRKVLVLDRDLAADPAVQQEVTLIAGDGQVVEPEPLDHHGLATLADHREADRERLSLRRARSVDGSACARAGARGARQRQRGECRAEEDGALQLPGYAEGPGDLRLRLGVGDRVVALGVVRWATCKYRRAPSVGWAPPASGPRASCRPA